MGNRIERTSDLAKAVHVLRQQGMTVSFPMQTAEGEIIFAVGGDFTLTADQILELVEREELHAEGVRRLVEAQGEKHLGNEGGGLLFQGEQAPRGLEVWLPPSASRGTKR